MRESRGPMLAFVAATLAVTGLSRADVVDECASAAEQGQALRNQGKLGEARGRLRVCAASTCPGTIRVDCARWLEDLDAAQPSFVVRATDPSGNDVPDVTVKLDGRIIATRLDGRAYPVDPGEHTVACERPGNLEYIQKLVMRLGERNRSVACGLVAASTRLPPPPSPPAPPGRGSALPWVVGGTGAATAAAGIALWVWGTHDLRALHDRCDFAEPGCTDADRSAIRTRLVAGDVAVLLGGLAVATAVWLFVRDAAPLPTARTAVVAF